MRFHLLAAACIAAAMPALAAEDLHIGHGWAAATDADTARVFINIENEGAAPVTLTAIRTDAAETAVLAAPPIKAGETAPVMLPEFAIAPGARLVMAPDGIHLLLTGLRGPLAEGAEIEVVLTIDPLGEIAADVDIEGANAEHESHAGHNH